MKLKSLATLIGLAFFLNCGETALLKDPMRVSVENYESRGSQPTILAGKDADCKLLFHKSIVNVLFVLPVNQLSIDEISDIGKQKAVRYKNVMRISDILWTTLLFLSGTIVYSIEVDSCSTEYILVKESDLNSMKQNPSVSREMSSIEASSNLNAPILLNYTKFVNIAAEKETSSSTVYFPNKSTSLSKQEETKIEKFISDYNAKYSKYNILLIGHADYTGSATKNLEISLERVKSVKEFMKKSGISELKIFTTSSGDYWPGNNDEKQGKEFNRRVDVILLE